MLSRARLLSDPNIVNVMPSEPSTQASGLAYVYNGISFSRLYWTNGSGGKRLLLCKQGSTFTAADKPIDGNLYNANADYTQAPTIGNARVVYKGNGSFNYTNYYEVTGLQRDTRHYWMVIEFNEGDNGVANYNINTATNNPRSWYTAP